MFFTDSTRAILLLPQVTEPRSLDVWVVFGCLCAGDGVRPYCPIASILRASTQPGRAANHGTLEAGLHSALSQLLSGQMTTLHPPGRRAHKSQGVFKAKQEASICLHLTCSWSFYLGVSVRTSLEPRSWELHVYFSISFLSFSLSSSNCLFLEYFK